MRQKKKLEKIVIAKKQPTEWVYQFWAWQVLLWSLYRYFLSFPEPVDEFIFKPLVFVLPVIWFVKKKEHRNLESIGLTMKNYWFSIILGCGFGLLFGGEAVVANILKFGSLQVTPSEVVRTYGFMMFFALSLATSFSEELLSRGFLFQRLYEVKKQLWYAACMSSVLFVVFHIPILLTTFRFTGTTLILFFLTNIVLGITNSLIFHKTKSLVAPILIHLFWNMTVAVFL